MCSIVPRKSPPAPAPCYRTTTPMTRETHTAHGAPSRSHTVHVLPAIRRNHSLPHRSHGRDQSNSVTHIVIATSMYSAPSPLPPLLPPRARCQFFYVCATTNAGNTAPKTYVGSARGFPASGGPGQARVGCGGAEGGGSAGRGCGGGGCRGGVGKSTGVGQGTRSACRKGVAICWEVDICMR